MTGTIQAFPFMWSSSFRHSGYDSDSDSDDGDNQPEPDPMREIDLSARHETVEYRPNPWSIARINAACRPPRRDPAPAPAKPPPKQQPKPIVEAFKRQADRAVRDVKNVPSPATATIPGSANKGSETLRNPALQPAHIPTHIPALESRRPFSTHTDTQSSSPVRQTAPTNATDVGNVATFRHGYLGPLPASAHTTRPSLPPVSAPTPPAIGQRDDQKTVPRWLLTALHKGLDASPSGNHPDPAHTRTPQPKRRCLSPDLSPPPPPKKPRAGMVAPRPGPSPASPSRRYPSAYAFGDDADAAWSTTRRAAPTNRAKRGGVRQSGRFRLPMAGLTRGMNLPPARPRVITYLPPPKATPAEAEEDVEVRVMDSDVTLVNEDGEDVTVDIDVDEVCARYPKTRARMKAESRVRKAFGCIVEVQV